MEFPAATQIITSSTETCSFQAVSVLEAGGKAGWLADSGERTIVVCGITGLTTRGLESLLTDCTVELSAAWEVAIRIGVRVFIE